MNYLLRLHLFRSVLYLYFYVFWYRDFTRASMVSFIVSSWDLSFPNSVRLSSGGGRFLSVCKLGQDRKNKPNFTPETVVHCENVLSSLININFFILVRIANPQILGLIPVRKTANFSGVPVRKPQIIKLVFLIRKA